MNDIGKELSSILGGKSMGSTDVQHSVRSDAGTTYDEDLIKMLQNLLGSGNFDMNNNASMPNYMSGILGLLGRGV